MAGRDGSLNPLKQRGIPLFHITTGSSTFSPAALKKKAIVNLYACLPFSTNPLSGGALKKQLDSSMFQIFSDGYLPVNPSCLSIQEVIVFSAFLDSVGSFPTI